MKSFILFGSSIMIIAILISAVAFINKKNEIPEKHLEVVLRDLGRQLLLTPKDSSSRVFYRSTSAAPDSYRDQAYVIGCVYFCVFLRYS